MEHRVFFISVSSIAFFSGFAAIQDRDAAAYKLRTTPSGQEVRWHLSQVPVIVDSSSMGDGERQEMLVDAVSRAVATWNAASSLELEFDPKNSVRPVGEKE